MPSGRGTQAAATSRPSPAPAARSRSAAGVLALAQRLHDEHVSAGESRRDGSSVRRSPATTSSSPPVSPSTTSSSAPVSPARRAHQHVRRRSTTSHSTAQAHHDEFVYTAQTQHDTMLAEANSKREALITEARERSTGMVHEAQQRKAAILQELSEERAVLERKIEQLRGFERDYRGRLKTYIEGQRGARPHGSRRRGRGSRQAEPVTHADHTLKGIRSTGCPSVVLGGVCRVDRRRSCGVLHCDARCSGLILTARGRALPGPTFVDE